MVFRDANKKWNLTYIMQHDLYIYPKKKGMCRHLHFYRGGLINQRLVSEVGDDDVEQDEDNDD